MHTKFQWVIHTAIIQREFKRLASKLLTSLFFGYDRTVKCVANVCVPVKLKVFVCCRLSVHLKFGELKCCVLCFNLIKNIHANNAKQCCKVLISVCVNFFDEAADVQEKYLGQSYASNIVVALNCLCPSRLGLLPS